MRARVCWRLAMARRCHTCWKQGNQETSRTEGSSFLWIDFSLERLPQIGDEVVRVLESDRQAHHAARDPRCGELRIRMPPLRREDRQAADALDAAKAGRASDHLQ